MVWLEPYINAAKSLRDFPQFSLVLFDKVLLNNDLFKYAFINVMYYNVVDFV